MIIKTRPARAAAGPISSRRASREAVTDIDDEVARLNRVVNEVLDFATADPVRAGDGRHQRGLPRVGRRRAGGPRTGRATWTWAATLPHGHDRRRAPPRRADQPGRQRPSRRQEYAGADCRRAGHDAGGRRVDARRRAIASRSSSPIAARASPPADLPRVFDPYFTTKRGRHRTRTADCTQHRRGAGRGPSRSPAIPAKAPRFASSCPWERRRHDPSRFDSARRRRRENSEGARPGAARRGPRGDRHDQRARGPAAARRTSRSTSSSWTT